MKKVMLVVPKVEDFAARMSRAAALSQGLFSALEQWARARELPLGTKNRVKECVFHTEKLYRAYRNAIHR